MAYFNAELRELLSTRVFQKPDVAQTYKKSVRPKIIEKQEELAGKIREFQTQLSAFITAKLKNDPAFCHKHYPILPGNPEAGEYLSFWLKDHEPLFTPHNQIFLFGSNTENLIQINLGAGYDELNDFYKGHFANCSFIEKYRGLLKEAAKLFLDIYHDETSRYNVNHAMRHVSMPAILKTQLLRDLQAASQKSL